MSLLRAHGITTIDTLTNHFLNSQRDGWIIDYVKVLRARTYSQRLLYYLRATSECLAAGAEPTIGLIYCTLQILPTLLDSSLSTLVEVTNHPVIRFNVINPLDPVLYSHDTLYINRTVSPHLGFDNPWRNLLVNHHSGLGRINLINIEQPGLSVRLSTLFERVY
jgi:hypothetical protein